MFKVPKGKVSIHVYVNEQIWKEFKRLAFQKHENFHGAISYELEQAIQSWIAQHTQNHTNPLVANSINPQPNVYTVFQKVKEYLKQTYGYGAIVSGQQIPKIHLHNAIMIIRGSDPRTVAKWMNLFQKFKLIKWIAGELYEVI